jgi:guanylate kinase
VSGRGRLVVVSGPSGVGKGTVIGEVLRRRPDLWLSVSTTTRAPRAGEQEGREYSFVSDTRFRQIADAGGFLEWAQYAGNLYGTRADPVNDRLQRGTSVMLEIDVAGARQVRRNMSDALLVFIAPPSTEELRRRLRGRGTETDQSAQSRLALAEQELRAQGEFDLVVTNSEVTATADELLAWCESRGL